MKILNAQQIRELDAYTIAHEPIASIDLMERAAQTFTQWFLNKFPDRSWPVFIFCGPGNNGGDGLAVARMLHLADYAVQVFLCEINNKPSDDFKQNLLKLPAFDAVPVVRIAEETILSPLPPCGILIDAILGSGVSRPFQGYWNKFISQINDYQGIKVSIDIPSGLHPDAATKNKTFCADYTFSFELPKLSFLLPQCAPKVGEWQVGSIGLHATYLDQLSTPYGYLTHKEAKANLIVRDRFAHKGHFGHALLIVGSQGMMGAALLSGRALLRSGAGLLTIHAPACGYTVLQTGLPEAMVSSDRHQFNVSELPDVSTYAAIGVGCGLGQKDFSIRAMDDLLKTVPVGQPLVLDADALNIIAAQGWQRRIPAGAILTPHPKEFSRLFGRTEDDFERLERLQQAAEELAVYIVLKGAHSAIAMPNGQVWFNSSGNPGMATAGSGDVLTGLLTGLLAQGYSPEHTCKLGVYLHGLAGDLAAQRLGHEALLASDIVDQIGSAYLFLKNA